MAQSIFRNVKISGLSAVVPEESIRIDDEIAFFNNDVKLLERNKKILGLGTRHVVDEKTSASDLCEAAANDLITALGMDKKEIDAMIVASSSHDYFWPATSCVLHGQLGLNEECSCFDVAGLVCSAYVYALQTAFAMVSSGSAKKILLLTCDLSSTHSDRRNRNSNMLFGDAAVATLIEYTEEPRPSYFYTGTRGDGWNKLIVPAGGSSLPIRADIAGLEVTDERGNVWHLYDDLMKGLDVFKFATEVTPVCIQRTLDFAQTSLEHIDYVAFHQANKQIVDSIARRVRLPKEKYSTEVFSLYGNCGSATVCLDLIHALNHRDIRTACLVAFGVGFSFGTCILNMQDVVTLPIRTYQTPEGKLTRQEKIQYWIDYFAGGNES